MGQLLSFCVLAHRANDYFLVSLDVLALHGDTDSSVPVEGALACHWPQALMLHCFISWHCLSLADTFLHLRIRFLQGNQEVSSDVGSNRLSCVPHPM